MAKQIVMKKWIYYLGILFLGFTIFSCVSLFIEQLGIELYRYGVSLFVSIVGILVVWYGRRWIPKVPLIEMRTRTTVVLLAVIPFVLRCVLLVGVHVVHLGDDAVYVNISQELTYSGIVETYAQYSLENPHLFWMGVFLMPASIVGNQYITYGMYMNLLLSIGNVLLYVCIKNLLKTYEKGVFISGVIGLIYAYLPSNIFACLSVTHEYAFNFIMLLVLFAFVKARDDKNAWLWWTGVGIGLACGKLVNSMGLIYIVMMIIMLLFFNDMAYLRRILVMLAMLVGLGSVSAMAGPVQNYFTVGETVPQASFQWAIYLGGNYEAEGRYNDEDRTYADRYAESVLEPGYTISDKNEVIGELAINRWGELVQNPLRLLEHLVNKYCNVWSGTHYSIEFALQYVTSTAVRLLLLGIMGVNNLVYLLLLVLAFIYQWECRKDCDKEPMFLTGARVAILGGVAVLLITEVMNKYNLTMMIPIILLIGWSASNLLVDIFVGNVYAIKWGKSRKDN